MRRSFTLIELLVVIGIIAILTAISVPAISAVRRKSQISAQQTVFQRLGLAIEQYQSDFGDFPPSTFKRSRLGTSNGQNEGIECLVRCLTTSKKTGPYFEFEDEQLGNTDTDSLVGSGNPTTSVIKSRELFECLDLWGNPLVYIHNANYDRGGTATMMEGGLQQVPAAGSEKTGQFKGLTTYQLWSAGPDGTVGTDDDIRHWGE